MQMDIQSQGFTLTDSLRDYLKKRLAYALNHGDEYISRVFLGANLAIVLVLSVTMRLLGAERTHFERQSG